MAPTDLYNISYVQTCAYQVAELQRRVMVDSARRGDIAPIVATLEGGPRLGLLRGRDDAGDTALTAAAEAGHMALVERLIALGTEVDQACRHGRTPLMVAVGQGHAAVVRVLCAAGASMQIPPDQEDHFMEGLFDPVVTYEPWPNGLTSVAVVEALVEGGADPRSHVAGLTLIYACENGDVGVVQTLVRAIMAMGMWPEWPQNYTGSGALAGAVRNGHLEVVLELLLARGSDDDTQWQTMIQQGIHDASRHRQHSCLLALQASRRRAG